MLVILILHFCCSNCLLYSFNATENYVLIEIFSDVWTNMSIEVAEDQVIQRSLKQQNTQYLQMYYSVEIGELYDLDIYLNPDYNYTVSEVFEMDCPNNCSGNGLCQKLECQCYEMITGDRCQYSIDPIFNESTHVFEMKPFETVVQSISLQKDDLVDDQQQIRDIKLTTNLNINSTIYFLLPFEQPYKAMTNSKLVYTGVLSENGTTINYQDKFATYHIKTANYSLILVLRNPFQFKQQFSVFYTLMSTDASFQDFILVAILSVVSFIILLVIIYIVRRRCQYMTSSKENKNSTIIEPQNALLVLMPIVEPAKDIECIICLDQLEQKQCRITPCKHILHGDCLQQWLTNQSNCPLCREAFIDEEGFIKVSKTRNQTTSFLNNNQASVVQSERNSVRSMILMRSRQSRLAVFQ